MAKPPEEFVRSLAGSELLVYFDFCVCVWYGRTREVSGVNRSLCDECFCILNVIPTFKYR